MARFVSIADRQGIASRSEGEKMKASSASTSFSLPKVSNVDTEKSNVALSQNRLGGPSMASSPPLCNEDGMAIPLQTEESKEAAQWSSSSQPSANSSKFARPRVYAKNCYESAGTSVPRTATTTSLKWEETKSQFQKLTLFLMDCNVQSYHHKLLHGAKPTQAKDQPMVDPVDLIENLSDHQQMLAEAQEKDSYFAPIRDKVGTAGNPFPKFFMKNNVLYKSYKQKHCPNERHVICLPDVWLPVVLHCLHERLAHSSAAKTKRNFAHIYYNRFASGAISSQVRACAVCVSAHSSDIKRSFPKPKPIRPRHKKGKSQQGDTKTVSQSPADADTANGTVNAISEEIDVPPAPEPPDIVLERSPIPLRRSPRFSANEALGLFSIQSGPSNEEDKSHQETDLGEETISFNAVDLHLDLSKQYRKSLGNEPSEIEDNEVLKRDETMSLPQRSALKKKRFVSFFFPAKPPYLLYPEKG